MSSGRVVPSWHLTCVTGVAGGGGEERLPESEISEVERKGGRGGVTSGNSCLWILRVPFPAPLRHPSVKSGLFLSHPPPPFLVSFQKLLYGTSCHLERLD